MLYASKRGDVLFECGGIGHVKLYCPFRSVAEGEAGPSETSEENRTL